MDDRILTIASVSGIDGNNNQQRKHPFTTIEGMLMNREGRSLASRDKIG